MKIFDKLLAKTEAVTPSSFLDFELENDHVVTGVDNGRREHYLLRLSPKQMDILGLFDRLEELSKLQTVLDGCEQVVPEIFVVDKTESLDRIRDYYRELQTENQKYEYIYDDLLHQLDGIEAESASVERAFYFTVTVRDRSQLDLLCAQLTDRIPFYIVQREEWILVLRNFLLREYTTYGLAEFDEEIKLTYQAQVDKEEKRRKPRSIEFLQVAKEETRRMLLPTAVLFKTRYAEQNDFLRKTVVVKGYPKQFESDCILRQLACMRNTTLRIRLEPLSRANVAQLINSQEKNSRAKARQAKITDRVDGADEQASLENTYREINQNNEKMCFVTILVEMYASNEEKLKLQREKVKNLLLTYGITIDDMLGQQRECFLSMMPFHNNEISLSRPMPSSTISALYPFTGSKKVDEHGLYLGRTTAGGAVFWDPHLRNDDLTSGNFLVMGCPGVGKSYFTKAVLSKCIAQGISCYVLDPENEYGDMFKKLGCSNIECGIGGYIINPLEVRIIGQDDVLTRDEYTPEAFLCDVALRQHLSWLRDFFPVLFPNISAREVNILTILVQEHYRQCGIDEQFDPRSASPTDYPTFTTLYEYINEVYSSFDATTFPEFNKSDLQNILLQLRDVYDGSGAAIFNGHTNVPNVDIINFQMQTLLNGSATRMAAVMFNILTWVMTRLVADPTQKQILTIDEAYLMIDRQYPVLIKWLRNYMKRDRKYEGVCGLITQNLGDFNDPEIMHITASLLQLPPHKFIFNLGDVDPDLVRNMLDLEDHEIKIVSRLRKRQCLFKCGKDKYLMEVGTLPYEKELFGKAGGR